MPVIELVTVINAPIERCFDLSRSIDLHKMSAHGTNEEAIAGVTTGLIGFDETVTWRAKHFGVTQTLSSKITAFTRPYHFCDEMIEGTFKYIRHDHWFDEADGGSIMKDKFDFESPGYFLGKLFNYLVLTHYLRSFLLRRNALIKTVAEGNDWTELI